MSLHSPQEFSTSSPKPIAFDEAFYEFVMQIQESEQNKYISDVIVEWKKIQTEKLIDQKLLSKEAAIEGLDLVREITLLAEQTLVEILVWNDDTLRQADTISILLTRENKKIIQPIRKQISILYAYRHDADLPRVRIMLKKLTDTREYEDIVLHIEIPKASGRVRKIYFTNTNGGNVE